MRSTIERHNSHFTCTSTIKITILLHSATTKQFEPLSIRFHFNIDSFSVFFMRSSLCVCRISFNLTQFLYFFLNAATNLVVVLNVGKKQMSILSAQHKHITHQRFNSVDNEFYHLFIYLSSRIFFLSDFLVGFSYFEHFQCLLW